MDESEKIDLGKPQTIKNGGKRLVNFIFLTFFVATIVSIAVGIAVIIYSFQTPNYTPFESNNSVENSESIENSNSSEEESEIDTKQAAIDFNNEIVDIQNELLESYNELGVAITTNNSEEIGSRHETAIQKTNNSIGKVQNIETELAGSEELKTATVELFNFYKDMLNNDYAEIITVNASDAPNKKELVQALITDLAKKEVEFDVKFRKAQESFATTHGFNLTTTP